MSLDVALHIPKTDGKKPTETEKIFIRRNGSTEEVTREEWEKLFPDQDPFVFFGTSETLDYTEVYSANITHNLNTMAEMAGIYYYLWRPDEIGVTIAKQLIVPLALGLKELRSDPDKFKLYNPPNGWGTYDGLVKFVLDYLVACVEHPEATIYVSR